MSAVQQVIAAFGTSAPTFTYATLDPSSKSSFVTLSNGNLTATFSDVTGSGARATQNNSSGKWYWEVTVNSIGEGPALGVYSISDTPHSHVVGFTSGSACWFFTGGIYISGVSIGEYGSYTTGDVLGFALDMGNRTLAFYKNGTLITTTASNTIGVDCYPGVSRDGVLTCNFGATSFAYPVPSGFNPGVYN